MSKMLRKTKGRHCHAGPLVGGLPLPKDKERRANRAIEAEQTRREVSDQLADGGEAARVAPQKDLQDLQGGSNG